MVLSLFTREHTHHWEKQKTSPTPGGKGRGRMGEKSRNAEDPSVVSSGPMGAEAAEEVGPGSLGSESQDDRFMDFC